MNEVCMGGKVNNRYIHGSELFDRFPSLSVLTRLKVAPRGFKTSVDGVYEVEAIIDHRPAEVGPEALNIELSHQVGRLRPSEHDMGAG